MKFLEQNQDAPKEKQFDKKFDTLTEIYRNILPSIIKDVMMGRISETTTHQK